MPNLIKSYISEEIQMNILEKYVKQTINYSNKFNLIGKSTIIDIWDRHILDSAQIFELLPDNKKGEIILDVGSGAGFPGMVLAIMGKKNVMLCEKSEKKVSFLRKILSDYSINAKIYAGRVELLNEKNIKIIVARAFAPLKKLISSIFHLIRKDTVLILHKGKKYKIEIEEALKIYSFSYDCKSSVSNKEGRLIIIQNIIKR